jgi:CRISPR-associated protein (TIGR03984 family)
MSDSESKHIGDALEADLRGWFAGQAAEGMALLLAHCDDGIAWGRVVDGTLELAGDHLPQVAVAFEAGRLQQARLFGPAGELLLWRDHAGWRVRRLLEAALGELEPLQEEAYRLWGDHAVASAGGFTLLADGRQGLLHAPPIDGLPEAAHACLLVRHYLGYDDNGQAYIALSRLSGLKVKSEKEGAQ